MAFEWMEPSPGLPESIRSARGQAMYRAELAERAALLCRLGYTRDAAAARLRANIAWEFEVTEGQAPSVADIDAVVATAYGK